MRTIHRTYYPTCRSCGVAVARGDTCDECMAEQFSGDVPTCEAPGCTREIGRAEKLCGVHIAIAAGEPPRLYDWQLEEAYRKLGDPATSKHETYSIEVPGIGHVTMARRRYVIEGIGEWLEWQAVAA